jgi:hypothetical protein
LDDDRLPSHIWIMAQIRRCNADGITAMVVQKGEAQTGTLLVKINQFEIGCRVLSQMRDLDGELGWMAAFDGEPVPESEADSYLERAMSRDPDIWVVEIEDREGRNPFEGKVF